MTALLAGLFSRDGRSMLNLLPAKAYTVQMGVTRVARQALFLVNAPETVREVLVDRVADFPKHKHLVDILQPLIGISLFNANGEVWQQQRMLVDQAFAQAGLRRAFPLMRAALDDLLSRIDRTAPGAPWDVDTAMSQVTADIIFRTILSKPLDAAQAQAVYAAFVDYQESAQRVMGLGAMRLPTWYHRARGRRQAEAIRASFAGLIHERFRATERGDSGLPDDMLAALIAARDPGSGARLAMDEVVDQVATLFLAGHETSASTLAWALYLLASQPRLQADLRSEIEELWHEREPEFGDTRQLTGIHNVFRETLRLYPPIPFYLRQAAQSTCLRDKPVAQGDLVVVSPWVVQRHCGLWDRPDEFDPARFSTDAGRASAKAGYLPFGDGPRACAGAAFATQESVLILAELVRRYRIEGVEDHVPRPTARLTLRSANGVRLRLFPIAR